MSIEALTKAAETKETLVTITAGELVAACDACGNDPQAKGIRAVAATNKPEAVMMIPKEHATHLLGLKAVGRTDIKATPAPGGIGKND